MRFFVRKRAWAPVALALVFSVVTGACASPIVFGIGAKRGIDASRLKIIAGRFVSYKITLRPYFGRLLVLKDAQTHRDVALYLAPNATINGAPFRCSGSAVAADPEPYGQLERGDGWCKEWVPNGQLIAAIYWDEPATSPQSLTHPPHLTTDAIVTL